MAADKSFRDSAAEEYKDEEAAAAWWSRRADELLPHRSDREGFGGPGTTTRSGEEGPEGSDAAGGARLEVVGPGSGVEAGAGHVTGAETEAAP